MSKSGQKLVIETHHNMDDEFPFISFISGKDDMQKDTFGLGDTVSDSIINLILQLNEDGAFNGV